ncbi:unnamed protein product [Closterium sp. NIES-54]
MASTRVLQQQGLPLPPQMQHSKQWGPEGPRSGGPSNGSANSGRDVSPCGYSIYGSLPPSLEAIVAICTESRTGEHLATFTRRPGSGLYTLTTESALVAESCQVAASIEVAASCSCHLLPHQTLFWQNRLGHPSLPCLRGMDSRLLVFGLPRSLVPLPRSLAPPCLPCVEGRQRAAPHSSFPPTTAPLQTLHMDVWSRARVPGQGGECYFLLVVDEYTHYTTVFPLQSKAEVRSVLICRIRAVCRQLSARFQQDLPVLRLHFDRGGEFSSGLLKDFCGAEGICQTFTLPASPQQNGIAEHRIGLVMETGKVGDEFPFRVWGALLLARDPLAGKLSPRTLHCVFLGVSQVDPPPLVEPVEVSSDTSGPAEGGDPIPAATVTPCHSACLAVQTGFPPRPSSLPLQPVAVDSSAAGGGTTGCAGSGGAECPLGTGGTGGTGAGGPGTSRQEALSPERLREWAVQWGSPGSGASRLQARGAGTAGARGAGTAGAGGSATGSTGVASAGGTGLRRQETLSPERLREWAVQWGSPGGGASCARTTRAGGAGTPGATEGTGGAAAVGAAARSPGSCSQESLSPERLHEWAVRWGSPGGGAGPAAAAGSGGAGLGGASAGVPGIGGTGAAGGTEGTGAARGTGGAGPGGASAGVPGVGRAGGTGPGGSANIGGTTGGTGVSGASRQESLSPLQLCEWGVHWGSPGGGAGGTGSGGAVATGAEGSEGALRHLLSLPPAATEFPVAGTIPSLLFPPSDQSQPQQLPGSLLPAPAPHTERFVLPSPLASSLPHVHDPESDLVRAASVTITRLLATAVTDPSFESAAAFALVAELVDFAALCCLDYAASLGFDSSCPPSVGGELALGCDVL